MLNKDEAYKKIAELVERFGDQIVSYKNSNYNETQTRRDFIDPFFKALGWDIDNENGYAESYREVIHEDKVKVGKTTKAPDYSFKLVGGKRLFFVEAKKPSISVKDEIPPAYQIRRYGWSAKLPISIITDFEEFAIYDCTKKPNPNDKASVARIKYLTFKDYLDEFDFLWETFSKERVLKGSFDKFIEDKANKKGTTTVDKAFLLSLDTWRTYLATTISWNNKNLDEDEINFAVQQTIDRIIFLRIAEDRGVEPENNLKLCIKSGIFYQNLFELFKIANLKYNSGLFDLDKDKLSRNLNVDNKVIRNIIEELYYPKCEYEFAVMPVEILGTAYEQFLGKVIRITPAHHAKIEEKPEVRKAGGVYYTPQYIVDYIVKNTVGKRIEGKTPAEVSNLKIVDPACGSGSFLIGAYQFLLDWHKDYYNALPPLSSRRGVGGEVKRGHKTDVLTPNGNLTTAEKKRILLNNIYGVDIDVNAVEVTKLSLLLKCMEGETSASIENQLSIFHERVLPTLDENIKSGNSLIDTDYYDDAEFDFGFTKKIKPFNWEKAFPEVFKPRNVSIPNELKLHAIQVIGQTREAKKRALELMEKYQNKVKEPEPEYLVQSGFDIIIGNPPYLKLTSNSASADTLLYYKKNFQAFSGGSSKNLFQLFLERVVNLSPGIFSFIIPEALLTTESNGKIREILLNNFNINSIVTFDHFVFESATIGTTIIVGERSSFENTKIIKIDKNKNQNLLREIKLSEGQNPWDVAIDDLSKNLIKKIADKSIPMGELVVMSKGMVVKNRNEILTQTQTEKSLPFLLGNCMKRYNYHYEKFAEYDKLVIIGGTKDISKHLATPRLLIRRTGSNLCATYSNNEELIESTIYILRSERINLKYLLGLINSKLLSYYLIKRLVTNLQGFPQVLMGQLEQLPIIKSNEKDQEQIIKLVDQLLLLNIQIKDTKLQSQIDQLQQHIAHCEDKINRLVYQIYGLSDNEIKIVEGK